MYDQSPTFDRTFWLGIHTSPKILKANMHGHLNAWYPIRVWYPCVLFCCSLHLEATSSFSTYFSGLGIVAIYLDITCPQLPLYIEGCRAIHRNNLSFSIPCGTRIWHMVQILQPCGRHHGAYLIRKPMTIQRHQHIISDDLEEDFLSRGDM